MKTTKIFFMLMIFLSLAFQNASSQKQKYKVGDRGPGGGIIIWDNFSPNQEGFQYIEAAPEDQGKAAWGCYGKNVLEAARKYELFDGRKNTEAILKACPDEKTAAKLAHDYRGGGKSDWHLPSSEEMKRMALSLKFKKLSNLESGYYWSSTQDSENSNGIYTANIFHYGIEHTISANKYNMARVRAVRTF